MTSKIPSPDAAAPAATRDGRARRLVRGLAADPWVGPLLRVELGLGAVLVLMAILAAWGLPGRADGGLPSFFLYGQDLSVLGGLYLALLLSQLPSIRLSASAHGRVMGLVERRAGFLAVSMAAIVAAVAAAGWIWPYHRYPLALDEFWASFDTTIFSRGRILAAIPSEWRPFASALQPEWRLVVPGDAYWSSTYLPMNAAFRALFAALGAPSLAGPFWAALSVLLVYRLARRFWPERRDAAVVAAVLLASSSQLLVMSISAYAMPAHLALNLLWLWLFLRKERWAQALAAAGAFAATGLHQVIFHPLFAAPFVLQLWLTRRWRLAAFHTAVYAAACLFWIAYWSLMLKGHGLAEASVMAGSNFSARVAELLAQVRWSAIGLMAANLLRFAAWQNPLTLVLALVGAPLALKAWRGPLAALIGGLALTILAMGVILPYQGHGWGYRYLHGFLGAVCLLAALGWTRLVNPADTAVGRRGWAALMAITAYAVLLALPTRLLQVDGVVRPFAQAFEAIRRADADVVVVDFTELTFGIDFVRNDPFLRGGPKVLALPYLTPDQVRFLCGRYRVALFDHEDAPGLKGAPVEIPDSWRAKAELARHPGCGKHVVAGR